jgi:DNA-binding XRE family transcriptional regulator
MICAYDETYLPSAQRCLGSAFDYAVNGLGMGLKEFCDCFLASPLSLDFASGIAKAVVGLSGEELVLEVLGKDKAPKSGYIPNQGQEYWTGWALAYYQWYSSLSFQEIDFYLPAEKAADLYFPYHEMDLRQFCDCVDSLIRKQKRDVNLAKLRKNASLSQRDLSLRSGISVRTIQQYEQRKKDINKASAWTLYSFSKALHCNMEDMLEKL